MSCFEHLLHTAATSCFVLNCSASDMAVVGLIYMQGDGSRWSACYGEKIWLVWTKEGKLHGDYSGLLWTNKSVPRLFLFKQITANTVRRAWALALKVLALKANNGVTHIHNPSLVEDTSAACFHVVITLIAAGPCGCLYEIYTLKVCCLCL